MSEKITRDEELSLIARAKRGDNDAAAALIAAHEGYLVEMVKWSKIPDKDDALQEVKIALLRAIKTFHSKHKCRFLTYASKVARWRLMKYSREKGGTIYIPSMIPNPELRKKANAVRAGTVSLNTPLNTISGKLSIGSSVASNSNLTEEVALREDIERLHSAILRLPKNERFVIRERMKDLTLEVIGLALKVSKERVRQIEYRARTHIHDLMVFGRIQGQIHTPTKCQSGTLQC